MNALAKMASAIIDASDNIHLIVSPTKKILKIALILFSVGVALITLSSGFLTFITIPLLMFELYFYYLFCKVWRSYKFSVLWLIMMPIAVIAVSTVLKLIIYNLK